MDAGFEKFTQPDYLEKNKRMGFVGTASSRDRFNSRLKAAPTGGLSTSALRIPVIITSFFRFPVCCLFPLPHPDFQSFPFQINPPLR